MDQKIRQRYADEKASYTTNKQQTDDAKKRVINNLAKMSEEEILKLGRLLALEKKKSLESE